MEVVVDHALLFLTGGEPDQLGRKSPCISGALNPPEPKNGLSFMSISRFPRKPFKAYAEHNGILPDVTKMTRNQPSNVYLKCIQLRNQCHRLTFKKNFIRHDPLRRARMFGAWGVMSQIS